MARRDPGSGTASLILDDTTASMAIHAISTSAAECEAHTREIRRASRNFPKSSYGRRNRGTIAVRETRIAARL